MERLTNHFDYCKMIGCKYYDAELFKQGKCKFFDNSIEHCHEKRMNDKLREYEDLEEQGLLIRLPVAEGSTVYVIDYILECKCDYDCKEVERCKCQYGIPCEHEYEKYRVAKSKFVYGMMAVLGKTVFLTKEEAEAELKEMNSNKGE